MRRLFRRFTLLALLALGAGMPKGRSHRAGDRSRAVVNERRDRRRYRNGVDSGRSLRHGVRRRRSRAGTGSRSGDRRVSHGPLRGHAGGLRPSGPDQRIAFQRSRTAHGNDQLGQGRVVLQLAIRSGRSPAVLQRCWRVRLRGQRVPAADRGGMGIRLPGRHRRAVSASARTHAIWINTRGTPTMRARKPTRLDARSPTPGDCSTCTATWPSGATTSTTPTTTRQARRRIPVGRRKVTRMCCGEAIGAPARSRVLRPFGSARSRGFPTPVSPAMPSDSAA